MSWRAFSANNGQLEAGSMTTASSFLPKTPPLALISSMAISVTSFNTVSLIAIVPDNECSTPTLIVSAACDGAADIASQLDTAIALATDITRLMNVLRCVMCRSEEHTSELQ